MLPAAGGMKYYPEVVEKLREAGHDVYDFRNPPSGDPGFKWCSVSEDYMEWSPAQYRDMLQYPYAVRQFRNDIEAMDALEKMFLPAYKAESGDDFTRITLYPPKAISAMTREERIEACYQHCCLAYADNESMNNQSVRERFGLNKNQGTIASHIISDTVSKGLIKSANPESDSRKFVSYVPFYA